MNDRTKPDEPSHAHDAQAAHKPTQPYRIHIDKGLFEIATPTVTGRELLRLAGKNPPEQFGLYMRVPGAQPRRVAIDESIDLGRPGVERFITLPLDQTEGLGLRRDFALPAEDQSWLESLGLRYELVKEGGVLRVVLYGLPVPAGYNLDMVDANVRIESGYPDSQIDMVYFHPSLSRADGRPINALCSDTFDGKTWQRWSRHRTAANPWRSGVDSLATHFALVGAWLERELAKVA